MRLVRDRSLTSSSGQSLRGLPASMMGFKGVIKVGYQAATSLSSTKGLSRGALLGVRQLLEDAASGILYIYGESTMPVMCI